MKLALAVLLLGSTSFVRYDRPTLPTPPQETVVRTEGMPNEADGFNPERYVANCQDLARLYTQYKQLEEELTRVSK